MEKPASHYVNLGLPLFSRLKATLNLCLIYLKLLVHVLQQYCQCSCDFEVNQTKIKGGCQSGRKVVTHTSKSDLPLVYITEKCYVYVNYTSNMNVPSDVDMSKMDVVQKSRKFLSSSLFMASKGKCIQFCHLNQLAYCVLGKGRSHIAILVSNTCGKIHS